MSGFHNIMLFTSILMLVKRFEMQYHDDNNLRFSPLETIIHLKTEEDGLTWNDLSMQTAIGMPFLLASYTLFIFGIYAAIILKPAIFHALPNQVEETEDDTEKERYKNSNLREEQKEQYLLQLQTYMEQNKPYQIPDLTCPDLARQMKSPNNYGAQIINEKLEVNFSSSLGNYRVTKMILFMV